MIYFIISYATVIILGIAYLFFQTNEVYVDEPVDSGYIINNQDKPVGTWIRYKRTYKNGKITFHEIKYK
jgi:hypothetical protein